MKVTISLTAEHGKILNQLSLETGKPIPSIVQTWIESTIENFVADDLKTRALGPISKKSPIPNWIDKSEVR